MAATPLDKKKDARYHALAATEKWKAFAAGMASQVKESAAATERENAQRKRQTTYARGELGGH